MSNRSCGSGSDGNAYKTVQGAINAMNSSEDIVNIRGPYSTFNGVYGESLVGTNKQKGANWEVPITIQKLTGDSEVTIDGGNNYSFQCVASGNYYWIFNNLKFTRDVISGDNFTHYLQDAFYWKFLNCTIEGCSRGWRSIGLTYQNCTFDGLNNLGDIACYHQVADENTIPRYTPNYVLDCTIQNYSSRGIWFQYVHYSEVLRNTIINIPIACDFDNFGKGEMSTYNKFNYNLVYHDSVASSGRGCELENCRYTEMKFNRIYNCFWGLDAVNYGLTDDPPDNYERRHTQSYNVIAYNVVFNCAQGGIVLLNSAGNKIYNNTIYRGSNGSDWHGDICLLAILEEDGEDHLLNNDIQNNIIYLTRTTSYYSNAIHIGIPNISDLPTMVIDNNIVYNPNQSSIYGVQWGGPPSNWNNYSLTEFKTAFPQWESSNNSQQTNPLLNDISGNDFTLQSGSPAINNGNNLGSDYIDGLDPESSWPNSVSIINQSVYGGWETGAYVHKSGGSSSEQTKKVWS